MNISFATYFLTTTTETDENKNEMNLGEIWYVMRLREYCRYCIINDFNANVFSIV